ncbi:tyrosine-protein phosphatase [Levilactobacillus hammesii]|nr:tyrosine-protein phosphatase [Levilactobacillus hammesii]
MHRSTIVKSLSLAGVVLSLMSVGVPSASAATATAQTPVTTETTTTGNQTSNSTTDQPHVTEEPTDPVALYGNVNDTLIKLAGTKNTRDIGGYKTADGKWQIKKNRLIRSDNLNKINNNDKRILSADRHVTSIVDFRTDGQISGLPDQHIAGVDNTSISILGEKAYTDSIALSEEFSGDGGFYVQQLEFGQSAIQGYNRFLNMLLQNNFATLYHCSSGKDRTGIATVLIMTILGMDEKTITNDFMQSAQTGRTVKLSWLKEYFREIKTRYTTMDRYITNVIGFSRPQQEKMRAMYLVSADGLNLPYQENDQVAPTPAPAPTNPVPAPAKPAPVPAPTTKPTSEAAKPTNKPTVGHAADTAVPAAKPDKAPHKAKKVKGKITSSKKLNTKYVYHLKSNKKWFKDAHLQKLLGHTNKKYKRTTWKLTNVERIKIKSKTYTYYKVKDHAGHKAWILKAYVVKITTHTTDHHK